MIKTTKYNLGGNREDDPTSTYDPLHENPSGSAYDPSFTGRQYWHPGDKTHYEPTTTSNVRYGMPNIPKSDLAYHAESKVDPGTMHGDTSIPSMRRGLGALVTLHLPSLWWRHLHMLILGLVLVTLFGYQNRYM